MALEHGWLPGGARSPVARYGWLTLPARWLARLSDHVPREVDGLRGGEAASDAATGQASVGEAGEAGEVDPFESFVRRFERQILNYLWRMTGDEQAAYDLTQEVFVRAWQHFATISQYNQPCAWLFRVATNLAVTHNTSRNRRAGPLSEISRIAGDDAPGVSDSARRFAESELVRQVLLQLSPKRRGALVLREVYGLSTAEVGEALGMSETAVRMAISRAREQFRALYLAEEGPA
jgi:RNA polymerase sigma-70 factor (ECF subfamily)